MTLELLIAVVMVLLAFATRAFISSPIAPSDFFTATSPRIDGSHAAYEFRLLERFTAATPPLTLRQSYYIFISTLPSSLYCLVRIAAMLSMTLIA